MSQARAEVAGWIDCVTRCATERETDAPDQASNQERAQARGGAKRGNGLRENGADHENKYECADYFAEKIGSVISDCGNRAENGKLRIRV